MKISVFRKQLLNKGIDIYSFRSWDKIEKLKVVSNSIKHAEGKSVKKLRRRRPDMFKNPLLRANPKFDLLHSANSSVYLPMAGDDIFVIQDDLYDYKNILVNFWNELIEICLNYEDPT